MKLGERIRHWTAEEDELLKRYPTLSAEFIANSLRRPIKGVRSRLAKLKMLKAKVPRWSPQEDDKIREAYAKAVPGQYVATARRLATILGRGRDGGYKHARELGLLHTDPKHQPKMRGCYAKFIMNPDCRPAVLSEKDRAFVEQMRQNDLYCEWCGDPGQGPCQACRNSGRATIR